VPEDVPLALEVLGSAGYRTELTDERWLAKVFRGEDFMDIVFSSMNGLCRVDRTWFDGAETVRAMGLGVRLSRPEEMIWQKAYVMSRHRYDGADIAHLIHARGESLDWKRLLGRFGHHWQLLLSHLVLFGFIYPRRRSAIPTSMMCDLTERLRRCLESESEPEEPECQGIFIAPTDFAVDLRQTA
jgi:hypothetical protein